METNRFGFAANLSWFDLMDTYLPGMQATIHEALPLGYMCAYPAMTLDGDPRAGTVPFCANGNMSALARKWGFGGGTYDGPGGYIESDCGAIYNIYEFHKHVASPEDAAVAALKAGHVSVNCDFHHHYEFCSNPDKCPLAQALSQGKVGESDLDGALRQTVGALMLAGTFDRPWQEQPFALINASVVGSDAHTELSR